MAEGLKATLTTAMGLYISGMFATSLCLLRILIIDTIKATENGVEPVIPYGLKGFSYCVLFAYLLSWVGFVVLFYKDVVRGKFFRTD